MKEKEGPFSPSGRIRWEGKWTFLRTSKCGSRDSKTRNWGSPKEELKYRRAKTRSVYRSQREHKRDEKKKRSLATPERGKNGEICQRPRIVELRSSLSEPDPQKEHNAAVSK